MKAVLHQEETRHFLFKKAFTILFYKPYKLINLAYKYAWKAQWLFKLFLQQKFLQLGQTVSRALFKTL